MTRPVLTELALAEEPGAWESLGFHVEDGACRIASTTIRLAGGGGGISGWAFDGAVAPCGDIDGLATTAAPVPDGDHGTEHPNGTVAIDHVVVFTPDTQRTCAALGAAGLDVRRIEEVAHPERPLRRGFVLSADVLVEVVGPLEPDGDGPATFWGLTLVVRDLDVAAGLLGERLGTARTAVQPGRRIATVRRDAGLSVPVALITPR